MACGLVTGFVTFSGNDIIFSKGCCVNDSQAKVKEFMSIFGQNVPESFSPETFPGALRVSLIEEEAKEFGAAVAAQDWPEVIDAICDLLYVTYGAAVALGIDVEPFFNEVHRSNMSKLDKHGRPIYRADGKVIKSSDWSPPDIHGLLAEVVVQPLP